jgi:hypothetical protein
MEYVFGFVGIILLTVALILAICYDGHNYNPFLRTISSLGDYNGRLFFSIGFVTSGCLGIPFYIRVSNTLTGLNEIVRRIATGVAIVACLGIAWVGVIPVKEFPNSFSIFHGITAFIAFGFTSAYVGLYSYLMLKDKDYTLLIPIIGFVELAVLVVFCITIMTPIIEWVLFILMFTWIVLLVIKKLRD